MIWKYISCGRASHLLYEVWGLPTEILNFEFVKCAFYTLSCLDINGSEGRNGKGKVGIGVGKQRQKEEGKEVKESRGQKERKPWKGHWK